jgi:hypothetical protein
MNVSFWSPTTTNLIEQVLVGASDIGLVFDMVEEDVGGRLLFVPSNALLDCTTKKSNVQRCRCFIAALRSFEDGVNGMAFGGAFLFILPHRCRQDGKRVGLGRLEVVQRGAQLYQ